MTSPNSPDNPRRPLMDANRALEVRGIDCANCVGECCTSRANSMQITPAEARAIRAYLSANGTWNDELIAKLRDCVREYRLDVELPRFGSRPNLRRTYTCPFYTPGPRGCSLAREVKPYGCIAFNPVKAGARGLADGCRSDQEALARVGSRLESQPDSHSNLPKAPIPVALLAQNLLCAVQPGTSCSVK
jgi:Fe-S-cluster containining protein